MSTLFLVGTPIGNLGDISQRALDTLRAADFIAAEDTRVSLKLLNRYGIKKPMVSYYEHNLRERGEEIISRILNGETCALVTDAGMPCVSDPGEDLVRLAAERGITVTAIPGPSAAVTALALSGLPTGRFAFEGFLSVKKSSRFTHLEQAARDTRTLIFYEAPHKLLTTLTDMLGVFGDRRLSIARELTKLHEDVQRFTISEALEYYRMNTPRGEFVLIIEGAPPETDEPVEFEDAVKMTKSLIDSGIQATQAAREIAKATGHKKSELYKAVLG